MPTQKKKQVIHAQISSPVLVRKTLLEAAILSIEDLKILKNIRQIKKRKDKLKTELRKICSDMRGLSRLLNSGPIGEYAQLSMDDGPLFDEESEE